MQMLKKHLRNTEKIRLYTFQEHDDMKEFEYMDYFSGNKEKINKAWEEEGGYISWALSYEFMCRSMKARIPNYSGDYPIWAWVKRPDRHQKRRETKIARDENKDVYLITIEIPRSRVLLSDFGMWHCPLNNGGIFLNGEDDDDDHQPIWKDVIESWNHIFDIERDNKQLLKEFGVCDRIQACVDRVYHHEVVSIKQL